MEIEMERETEREQGNRRYNDAKSDYPSISGFCYSPHLLERKRTRSRIEYFAVLPFVSFLLLGFRFLINLSQNGSIHILLIMQRHTSANSDLIWDSHRDLKEFEKNIKANRRSESNRNRIRCHIHSILVLKHVKIDSSQKSVGISQHTTTWEITSVSADSVKYEPERFELPDKKPDMTPENIPTLQTPPQSFPNSAAQSQSQPQHPVQDTPDFITKTAESQGDEQSNNKTAIVNDVVYGPETEIPDEIEPQKRKKGRPKGSKNKIKNETKQTPPSLPQEAANSNFHILYGIEDEEIEVVEAFLSSEVSTDETRAGLEASRTRTNFERHSTGDYETQPGEAISTSKAFDKRNPFRPKWVEAAKTETARLGAYECWRKLGENDKIDSDKVILTALIMTRKRCGRFKARLVVLGNRWVPQAGESPDVFASVVSRTGSTINLVRGAHLGWHGIASDITNAFTRANIDRRVIVTLPKEIYGEDRIRILEKALYGLPISPKLWMETLAKDLLKLKWVECLIEPGLWRISDNANKIVASMTVYADDCTIVAETYEVAIELHKQIHDTHPTVVTSGEDGVMGILGALVEYRPFYPKIPMPQYTDKLMRKFDMQGAKPLPLPEVDEA